MLVMLSMNSLIIDMDLCCWLKVNVHCNVGCQGSYSLETFLSFAIWSICLHRIKVIFKKSPVNLGLLREANCHTSEYFLLAARSRTNKKKHVVSTRWTKLEEG